MKFELVELDPNREYSFVIGTSVRPDKSLRDELRSRIERAMESLGREPGSYSVSIVRSLEDPSGSPKLPPINPNSSYILFAMLPSGEPSETIPEAEFEEQRGELERGLITPPGTRIALVLLHNATVETIETARPLPAFL